ncbi:hypothetical protein ZWY2020_058181, partial [Hordeum vulgare]
EHIEHENTMCKDVESSHVQPSSRNVEEGLNDSDDEEYQVDDTVANEQGTYLTLTHWSLVMVMSLLAQSNMLLYLANQSIPSITSKPCDLMTTRSVVKLIPLMLIQTPLHPSSPHAYSQNKAFTDHIVEAMIRSPEEKLELEFSIPRKLHEEWEPTIKIKIKNHECNALCDLGANSYQDVSTSYAKLDRCTSRYTVGGISYR